MGSIGFRRSLVGEQESSDMRAVKRLPVSVTHSHFNVIPSHLFVSETNVSSLFSFPASLFALYRCLCICTVARSQPSGEETCAPICTNTRDKNRSLVPSRFVVYLSVPSFCVSFCFLIFSYLLCPHTTLTFTGLQLPVYAAL